MPFVSVDQLSRLLLDLPKSLRLDAAAVEESALVLMLRSAARSADCPCCERRSSRVHSEYLRVVDDARLANVTITAKLVVRRFRCDNTRSERSIFAERLSDFVQPHARRTTRSHRRVVETGMALGGEAAARLLRRQGVLVSADTVLRAVRAEPAVQHAAPRAIGIDDFALRRGHRYGTVIVDLDRRRIIDVLPSRDVDAVAQWLRAHPTVRFVARDRAEVYAEGTRRGAPHAVQIADRWHLLKNAGDALEHVLLRHRAELKQAVAPDEVPAAEETAPSLSAQKTKLRQLQRQDVRRQLYDEVHRLANSGVSIHQITRTLGKSRATIRRYLRAKQCPTRAPRRTPINSMGRYDEHLRRRWSEGENNARVLHRELQAMGYRGSQRSVQRHVAAWVTTEERARRGRRRTGRVPTPARAAAPSPRQARWWLTLPSERLSESQRAFAARLMTGSEPIADATRLASSFALVLRDRKVDALDRWLVSADASMTSEFREFASSLRRDLAAVRAAVTLAWSNGQTEGQVNKIKMFKRQMFGRANVDLLRARLLQAV